MSEFKWSKGFDTGNEVIDEHHRRLMARVNEMEALINKGGGGDALDACHQFRAQIRDHFAAEEDLLRAAEFTRLDDHIASHAETEEELNQVISSCGEACINAGSSACVKKLGTTLLEHFVRGDLDFKSHLQTRNLARNGVEDG